MFNFAPSRSFYIHTFHRKCQTLDKRRRWAKEISSDWIFSLLSRWWSITRLINWKIIMLHDARNKKRKKKIRDISRLFARVFRDEGVKGSKIVGTVTTNIPCVYRYKWICHRNDFENELNIVGAGGVRAEKLKFLGVEYKSRTQNKSILSGSTFRFHSFRLDSTVRDAHRTATCNFQC